jgi:hypothetical protein
MPHAKILISSIFLIFYVCIFAEVVPTENSILPYTTVYFEEDLQPGAKLYELLLYADSSQGASGFLTVTRSGDLPAFWIPGLAWATEYRWRLTAYDKEHNILYERMHMFATAAVSKGYNNAGEVRVEIKKNEPAKHAGGLVLVDYARAMYDRNGTAVWTLPDIPGYVDANSQIRDMKFTSDHTITFLTDKAPLEIDPDAKVLWKGPFPFVFKKDTIIYHHELRKTKRGTYMVLGTRKVKRRLPGSYTPADLRNEPEISLEDGKAYKKTQITVLLEFNRNGDLIWFWDANDYIADADLGFKKYPNGSHTMASHCNAFSENEKGTKIYMGFRDLSRIIRIDKASKKVELSYGEKYPSGEARLANHLFRKQHDATITAHNSILIFNNNDPAQSPGGRVSSGILELRDQPAKNDSVLLWSFDLDFDTLKNDWSSGGGNVVEMPNTNLLLCGGVLNRVFEVTRGKEVVWDAFVMCKPEGAPAWRSFPQYRCNWTEKLGMSHFMARLHQGTAPEKTNLTITNTGNTEDVYLVEVLNENNKRVSVKRTDLVHPGESVEENLGLSSKKDVRLKVKISSRDGMCMKQFDLAN